MFGSVGKKDDDFIVPPKKKKVKQVKKVEKVPKEEYKLPNPFQYNEKIIFERLPPIKMDFAGDQEDFGDKSQTPLELFREDIHVNIVAGSAEVTSFMTFQNDYGKVLEGQLVFPLPKDTSIHGYGLDIDGTIIDAVPVPKEKARIAFEQNVRERGPEISIAEQVDAYSNVFSTKIYPMPAHGQRTAKVVVLSSLVDDGESKLFYLDKAKPDSLKEFSFEYNAPAGTELFVLRKNGNLEAVKAKDITGAADFMGILMKIPKESKEEIITEENVDEDVMYFSASLSGLDMKGEDISNVKKISMFYDVSGSRTRDSDLELEASFLKEIFQKYNGMELEVITFSCEVHEKQTFTAFSEVQKYLKALRYDGGTALPLNEISTIDKDTDFILLFSDGIVNFGKDLEQSLFDMKFGCPIYSVSSSANVAYIALRYLGNQSGGNYIDLINEGIDHGMGKIGQLEMGVRNIEYDRSLVSDCFASEVKNGFVTVFGVLTKKKDAKITIDFGKGNKKSISISAKKNLMKNSSIVRTLWAKKKIDQLSIFASKNELEIRNTGLKYGIVTPGTSLIVLSEYSQYEKYKIPPPASLKKVLKEWEKKEKNVKKEEEQRKKEKLRSVISKWNGRVSWHKQSFEPVEEEEEEEVEEEKECRRERRCEENDDMDGLVLESLAPPVMEDMLMMEAEEERCCAPPMELCKSAPMRSKKKKMKKKTTRRVAPPQSRARSIAKRSKSKKSDAPSSGPSSSGNIQVKSWQPGSSYYNSIANSKDPLNEYFVQKKGYEDSPSFYLDCSDYFLVTLKDIPTGVRILSNITELGLNDVQLLRIVGYRLDQAEKYEESIQVFEKVKKLKPEEPQSYRDLALVIEKTGDLKRSAELLYEVICGKWDSRFDEIELTAAVELNHILFSIENEKEREKLIQEVGIDKALIYHFHLDVRISMAWDTDSTDIDLHVYDPKNEHCYYSHKQTEAGGMISRDFTQGYGPEEFMQKKVWKSGVFRITAKYFASHQQSLTGGTTILLTFFTHYMTKKEKRALVTLRLSSNKSEVEVAQIDFKVE